MKYKICIKCKTEFIPNSNRQRYCFKKCYNKDYKIKNKIVCKNYYKTHKEELKEYYSFHKKQRQVIMKKYRETHKKQIKEYRQNSRVATACYQRNRRKVDINYKLTYYLRNRLRLALKGSPKASTTMKLIGCSIEQLKQHLESQFVKGMNWNNHSFYGWHIDHIRPCCSFDLSKVSEQIKCFNYKNLQPLWAKDNLKKSGNIL